MGRYHDTLILSKYKCKFYRIPFSHKTDQKRTMLFAELLSLRNHHPNRSKVWLLAACIMRVIWQIKISERNKCSKCRSCWINVIGLSFVGILTLAYRTLWVRSSLMFGCTLVKEMPKNKKKDSRCRNAIFQPGDLTIFYTNQHQK